MKLQVLVTTMNKNVIQLIDIMKLKESDVIVANQNGMDRISYYETSSGHQIKEICSNTKGVSINRNIAINNSVSEIIVFSDDDQIFVDNYFDLIVNEFEIHPEAEAIKFYCESTNPTRPLSYKRPHKFTKANTKNLMSAGIVGFAIKSTVLKTKDIKFKENIGPGKEIYLGEDCVFYKNILDNKINVYLSPILISYIKQEQSSWFLGYSDQYFISVGYIYHIIYKKLAIFAMIRRAFLLKKKNDNSYSIMYMLKLMIIGMKKQID